MAGLTPADIPGLQQVLLAAISPDPAIQKAAEGELGALATRPAYCSCLAEIVASQEADPSCRWIAVLQLKNTIIRHWRTTQPGAVSTEEKAHLRARLLDLVPVPDRQLAVQVCVSIAKVARADYPKQWQDLFPTVLSRLLGAGSSLAEQRWMLALHVVLKELASKRLQSDVRAFEEAAALVLPALAPKLGPATAELAAAAAGSPPEAHAAGERWQLLLKCLGRLLSHGSPSDARTLACPAPVVNALPALLAALRTLSTLRAESAAQATGRLLKTLRRLQEVHPWSFWPSGTLLPLLEWMTGFIVNRGETICAEDDSELQALLTRRALALTHQVLCCPSYAGVSAALSLNLAARRQVGQQADMAAQVRAGLEGWWAQGGRRGALLRALVADRFPLSREELADWSAAPEAFHHEMMTTAWEESTHGCAENLAVALFEGHREELAPIASELLATACQPGMDLLHKEAVYRLAAVAADQLHGAVDFRGWLHSTLLVEARGGPTAVSSPDAVRRQALLLPSYWLGVLRPEDRPPLYEAMLCALGRDADLAIRLAALVTLTALVEDWGFEEAPFLPFVPACFDALAGLLQDVTELDSQLQAFHLLNSVIDRLADGAAPFAPGLLTLLPGLWAKASTSAPLLGMQVLGTLTRLVFALGSGSPAAYPLLVPALRSALVSAGDPGLVEDALQTWLVALRCAPGHGALCTDSSSPLLGELWYGAWTPVLGASTEHVAVGSNIAASGLLLGGHAFLLSEQGTALLCTLSSWLRDTNDRGVAAASAVVAIATQLRPEGDGTAVNGVGSAGGGPSTTAGAMATSAATLASALRALSSRLLADEGSPGALGALGAAPALCALSRAMLALGPAAALHAALEDPGSARRLAETWISRFDAIGRPGMRVLAAMGLASLLALPVPGLLEAALEPAAAHLTAVWFETEESGAGGREHLRLDFLPTSSAHDDGAIVDSEEADGEGRRRDALWAVDPVRTTRLGGFVAAQLEAAAGVHGTQALGLALAAMDPTLREQLQRMTQGHG